MFEQLENTYGEARKGGLNRAHTSFFISHNKIKPNTDCFDMINIKKNDVFMIVGVSSSIERRPKIRLKHDSFHLFNKTFELCFWFTILIHGVKIYHVNAQQLINCYQHNHIRNLSDFPEELT